MTSAQLVDLLIARLTRDHGGMKHHWRRRIGPVRIYSEKTHAHCNWAIDPTGSGLEIGRIETLLDELRLRHPFLVEDR